MCFGSRAMVGGRWGGAGMVRQPQEIGGGRREEEGCEGVRREGVGGEST